MVKFMGNGKRIEHVLRALLNDCLLVVSHIKDKRSLGSHSTYELINFMVDCGYNDVFVLQVNPEIGGNYAI